MKNFQQFDGAYGKFLKIKSGAGNQVRTGDLNLGKVALYQTELFPHCAWLQHS